MDVTRCPDPESLLSLLYDDEGSPEERHALQAHVERCGPCADVLTSLDAARGVLGAWHAPRLPLGFALVRSNPSPYKSLLWRGGLAAAAVLVLAAGASLARLDVSYTADGFHVRTGHWSPPVASATGSLPDDRGSANWVGLASAGEPPWRQDLDMLATQLRTDMGRLIQESRAAQGPSAMRVAALPPPAGPVKTMSDAEVLKRVQDMLDQSEIRQQANLALRVTELGRQFELQRQGDIVQVEQAFQRLEQQRNDLLRRVAAQQPRP